MRFHLEIATLKPLTDVSPEATHEWWQLFKKNQVSLLERQKQLGYVKEYTIYSPSLHTSEESRWDYRIVIVRASADAPLGQSERKVAKQLFPDQATYKRVENRRWELTANHWASDPYRKCIVRLEAGPFLDFAFISRHRCVPALRWKRPRLLPKEEARQV
jgi:hypothetical protein